jgi:plastocyanin
MRFSCAPVLIFALVAACGGGGNGTDPGPTQTLESISVSPSPLNLIAGVSTAVSITGTDTQGQPVSGLTGIQLTSQNPAIAEVAGTEVLGIASGSTTITVSASKGGVTKQATVTANVTGSLPSSNNVTATVSNTFTPSTVVVARTGQVTWAFGSVAHNVTFAGVTGAPQNIGPPDQINTSVSRTFNTTGNFPYQCTTHAGMSGTVLVR